MYFAFEHPIYLWYLLAIPLLIVTHYAFLKYTRRRAMRFANFQALRRVTDEKVVTKNHLMLIIRCAIVFCLILAIAGTTLWYKGESNNNDFVIAMDTSSSMTAQDFDPTRIDTAKEYVKTFIDNIDSDANIGIVTFSGASFIEHLPSSNKGEVKRAVSDIEPSQVGGTDIAGAVITGCNMLAASTKGKLMILITDGSNTVNFFTKDPVEEAIKYARANSVSIYTIGLGTNSGPIGYLPEYYNVSSVFDDTSLKRIAEGTGYEDILSNTHSAYIPLKLNSILAVLSLIMIFIEWGLINTRFRSLP